MRAAPFAFCLTDISPSYAPFRVLDWASIFGYRGIVMSALKIVAIVVGALAVVVIAAGLAMYFRLIPIPGPLLSLLAGAKEPEHSARYYPPDTLAYAWATLTPGGGQFNNMQDIWSRFNEYPEFEDLVDEFKKDFRSETGIDFDDEVVPWIGPEISAGIVEVDAEYFDVSAVIMFGVRDGDAAEDFLSNWLQFMEDDAGIEFEEGSHRGVDVWVDNWDDSAYALTDDWLVYATGEDTLESVLDRIAGRSERSLADRAKFQEARAALPDRRFHSVYVNSESGAELLENASQGFGSIIPGVLGPAAFADATPDWFALTAAWVDRGVVIEMVSPTVSDLGLEVSDLGDPGGMLPDDTMGYMAASFDPDIENWREALDEYRLIDVLPDRYLLEEINYNIRGMTPGGQGLSEGDTLADALDIVLEAVDDATGIDLEEDFFAHLAGGLIVTVSEFDFDAVEQDPALNAVDGAAMLSYDEAGKIPLADTMGDITDLIEESTGLSPDEIDVGADDDAVVFDFAQWGEETSYLPGYVIHDGYVTLGSTEDILETLVELQNGDGVALTSHGEYSRAVGHLPSSRQFMGYIGVNLIIDQFDADDLDLQPDEFEILDEGLGVVAFGADVQEEITRATVVLTLFPE